MTLKDFYPMKENLTLLEHTGTTPTNADNILRIAMDVGEQMVRCGAEISRVEDTVTRITKAYGAHHVEIFAIQSLIIAAIRMEDGEYSSQIRRIDSSSNDLYRIEIYNAISRKICKEKTPLCEVDKMLREAKNKKPYPKYVCALSSAIATGAFALFFGGDMMDALLAAIIGIIIFAIDLIPFGQMNRLAKTVMQSFVGGTLTYLGVAIGLGHNVAMIMIGTIMILIPGLSFGTAFRDLFCGDFLAGTLRTVQCFLAALMIAAGYLLSMFFVGGIL